MEAHRIRSDFAADRWLCICPGRTRNQGDGSESRHGHGSPGASVVPPGWASTPLGDCIVLIPCGPSHSCVRRIAPEVWPFMWMTRLVSFRVVLRVVG